MMPPQGAPSDEDCRGYELATTLEPLREASVRPPGGHQPPLLVDVATPLGEIAFDFAPPARQVWVQLHALGRPATWIAKREDILARGIFLLLSDRESFSFTGIRLLSSLGIPCGLRQEAPEPDWEAWADLLGYAAYAVVQHAPIEPFDYALRTYRPDVAAPFSMDALAILVRERLRPAVQEADGGVRHGRPVDTIQAAKEADRFFLDRHPCSYCSAWRICMGTYQQVQGEGKTRCREFFLEWMEACECPAIDRRGLPQ